MHLHDPGPPGYVLHRVAAVCRFTTISRRGHNMSSWSAVAARAACVCAGTAAALTAYDMLRDFARQATDNAKAPAMTPGLLVVQNYVVVLLTDIYRSDAADSASRAAAQGPSHAACRTDAAGASSSQQRSHSHALTRQVAAGTEHPDVLLAGVMGAADPAPFLSLVSAALRHCGKDTPLLASEAGMQGLSRAIRGVTSAHRRQSCAGRWLRRSSATARRTARTMSHTTAKPRCWPP